MLTTLEELLNEYYLAMREGQAALFVGAGMSTPVGFPDWKELLANCAAALDLDIERETDLIAVAQYYVNGRGNRSDLNQILRRAFDKPRDPTPSHRIIARLPISTIWTTNYDKVMEEALSQAKKRFDIRSKDADFAKARKGEVVLYKMHGDIDDPNEVVICESDYERYAKTHPIFQNALEGDLITKTFLFLGFSFTDRNLSYMLAGLRSVLGDSKRVHYAIMRKERLNWSETHPDAEKGFSHKARKQELHVKNLMMRYGIHTLLVDEDEAVPEVLKELGSRFRKETVFVSGRASDPAGYEPERLRKLFRLLGALLMRRELNLIADFRTDVGRALLDGALQELKEDGRSATGKHLLQQLPGGVQGDEIETDLDRAMALDPGFAILVGGGKARGGEFRYDSNKAKEAVLIPIGASGSASHKIWTAVLASQEDNSLKKMFKRLNDSSLDEAQLVDAVFDIIDTIGKKAPRLGSRKPTLMNREFFVRLMKQFPNAPPNEIRRIIAAASEAQEKTRRARGKPIH